MAEKFDVTLVSYSATGLDRIELDLNKVKAATDAALPSMERIFGVAEKGATTVTKGTQALNSAVASLGRTARAYQNSFGFALAGLGSGNPMYAPRLSGGIGGPPGAGYSPSSFSGAPKGWTWGGASAWAKSSVGRVGGALEVGVSAVGTATFATGASGLQGTVPMARLQNQFNRLAWELGNTLTPQIEGVTRRVANAANWLNRQDSGTQDVIGYGVTGAGVLGGARLAGLPVDRAARGAAALGWQGAKGAYGLAGFGGAAAGALPADLSLDAAVGGGVGSRIAAGGSRLGGAALAAVLVGGSQLALHHRNVPNLYAAAYGSDTGGFDGIGAEYEQKFRGLSDGERRRAINAERQVQLNRSREGVNKFYGEGGNLVEQMGERLLSGLGVMSMGDTGDAADASRREKVLRAMYGGKKFGQDHRANPYVGGEWGEVGSGYYSAASAFAKAGFDKGEGGGGGQPNEVVDLLKDIRDKLPDRNQLPAPGNGNGNPALQGNHLGPGFGS